MRDRLEEEMLQLCTARIFNKIIYDSVLDFRGRGILQKINVDKYAVARYHYKKNGS